MSEYKFPVAIGDTVRAVVEDENHIVDLIDYKVCGVAQIGDKQYVFDDCGEMYEIGAQMCLVMEGRVNENVKP